MAIEVAKLFASVGIDTKNFDKGINGLKSKLGGLDKGLSAGLGGVGGIAALAGVGAVAALGDMQLEMAKAGAKAGELKKSFNDLATGVGQSGEQMLSQMRTASAGLVSDTELIQSANRAMLLGVADTGEEMGQLLEIARVRGRAMGLDLSTAFDNIVTGLGRMSPLILDNLGIVVDQDAANKEYAASLGKVASALTEAEKKQALLNAVIRDSQGLIAAAGDELTDAEKIQSMAAATQNLSEAWGQLLLSMGVPELYQGIASGLNDIAIGIRAATEGAGSDAELEQWQHMIEQNNEAIHGYVLMIGTKNEAVDRGAKKSIEALRAENELIQGWIDGRSAVDEFTGGLPPMIDEIDHYREAAAASKDGSAEMEAGLAALGIKLDETGDKSLVAAEKMKQLQAIQDRIVSGAASLEEGLARRAGEAASFIGEEQAMKLLKGQLDVTRQRTSEMRFQQLTGADLVFEETRLKEEAEAVWDQIEENRKTTEKWAKATPQITEGFKEIQSVVESALSGAFDLSDIKGDAFKDLLPRQDAVNEDARRLADIAVKGWDSPWVDYFRTEYPALWAEAFSGTEMGGDIKLQAAEIMKQFEAGLRPELLDRDMLKDQIRNAVLGKQAMDAMVEELSTELAEELGIAMTEIKGIAGGVVGTGDSTGGLPLPITPNLDTTAVKDQLATESPELGLTLGTGVETGVRDHVEDVNLGKATSDQVAKQMSEAAEAFKVPGQNAGEQWGLAFLERVGSNVPQQLIDMLINLITPGIQGNQANAETQTTAEGGPQ